MTYAFKRGLGESGGIPASMLPTGYPGYCSWFPFADYMDACKVPTQAQLLQQNLSNYGPAATPDVVLAGQQAAAAADAADCAANPEVCGEFTFAGNSPLTAATFGAGTTGQSVGALEQAAGTLTGAAGTVASLFTNQWTWIALAAVAVLYFTQGGRR